jgi:HEAT repeat protein
MLLLLLLYILVFLLFFIIIIIIIKNEVRHEAAEALGAIASRKEIYTLLKEFSASHHPRIIRESCHVALGENIFFLLFYYYLI